MIASATPRAWQRRRAGDERLWITDALIEELVAEAKAGYDVED